MFSRQDLIIVVRYFRRCGVCMISTILVELNQKCHRVKTKHVSRKEDPLNVDVLLDLHSRVMDLLHVSSVHVSGQNSLRNVEEHLTYVNSKIVGMLDTPHEMACSIVFTLEDNTRRYLTSSSSYIGTSTEHPELDSVINETTRRSTNVYLKRHNNLKHIIAMPFHSMNTRTGSNNVEKMVSGIVVVYDCRLNATGGGGDESTEPSVDKTSSIDTIKIIRKLRPIIVHVEMLLNGLRKNRLLFEQPDETPPRRLSNNPHNDTSLKDSFLATMSHEIRTPLNGIVGSVTLLQETSPISPEQQVYINILSECSGQLLNLIGDILDFGRIHSGTIVLLKESFSVHECVRKSLDIVRHKAKDKKIDLVLDIPEVASSSQSRDSLTQSREDIIFQHRSSSLLDTVTNIEFPSKVIGDPLRLSQILINLLSNAIKYTTEGYVRLRVRASRSPDVTIDNGSYDNGSGSESDMDTNTPLPWNLEFEVQDTGRGVSVSDRDRIFEMFTKADPRNYPPSSTEIDHGVGLGLAISKKLVELMGGHIDVVDRIKTNSVLELETLLALDAKTVLDGTTTGSNDATTTGTGTSKRSLGPGVTFRFSITLPPDFDVDEIASLHRDVIRGRTAIVVDDREDNRIIMMHILLRFGMVVQTFSGGKEALAYMNATKGSFDIAVIDVFMPGMNGIKLAQSIRENGFTQPLIGVSSVGEDVAGRELFDYFIQKPIVELNFVKAVVKHLRVRSNNQRPSTIPVSSPLVTVKKNDTATRGSERKGSLLSTSPDPLTKDTVKLIIAEDDYYNRLVIRKMLETLGYKHIKIVVNGQECVDEVKLNRYHICLMDVKMPVMNGIQATKLIKALPEHPFIIAVSASVLDSDIENCLSSGMDAYIPKPIDKSKLDKMLSGLLSRLPSG